MATTQIGEATERIEETTTAMGEAVGERLSEVAGTAGEVVRGASEVVREADRTLRGSSDPVLGMVAALSVGLAIGFVQEPTLDGLDLEGLEETRRDRVPRRARDVAVFVGHDHVEISRRPEWADHVSASEGSVGDVAERAADRRG